MQHTALRLTFIYTIYCTSVPLATWPESPACWSYPNPAAVLSVAMQFPGFERNYCNPCQSPLRHLLVIKFDYKVLTTSIHKLFQVDTLQVPKEGKDERFYRRYITGVVLKWRQPTQNKQNIV